MATPATTMEQKTAKKPIAIYIGVKGRDVTASLDPFWVSKSNKDEVQWFCTQSHNTHGQGCFTIRFDGPNGSPFETDTFLGHGACSKPVRNDVQPDKEKLYKYTVTIPGYDPLDPHGGVTP